MMRISYGVYSSRGFCSPSKYLSNVRASSRSGRRCSRRSGETAMAVAEGSKSPSSAEPGMVSMCFSAMVRRIEAMTSSGIDVSHPAKSSPSSDQKSSQYECTGLAE